VTNHAQVEQGNAMIVREEDVARMRICMEESVDKNLLQIGVKKFFRQI
jgi:hypothetical protein